MVEMRKPIPVSEAVRLVMEHVHVTGTEMIPLEHTYGRILAEPIIAKHDVPSFDRSPYDGFAIRAEDTAGASGDNRIPFTVIGEIGAGHVADRGSVKGSIPNYDGCADSGKCGCSCHVGADDRRKR